MRKKNPEEFSAVLNTCRFLAINIFPLQFRLGAFVVALQNAINV